MRKIVALAFCLFGFMPLLTAEDGCRQHLSREEFREKQKAFIIEQAGLTEAESAKFFPVYYELQELKKKLNDESWELIRKGRDGKSSEAEYEEIIERVCDNRIAATRLDKSYLDKFKKILSCKKIYLVQHAEVRFHREILRGMRHRGGKERRGKK